MAFCEQCGNLFNKFFGKSSKKAQKPPVALGIVTPQQMKENLMQGHANQVLADIHAGYREPKKPNVPPAKVTPKKSILLLIVFIIGVCVPLFWLLISFHFTNYGEVIHSIGMGERIIEVDNLTRMRIYMIWTFSSLFSIIPSIILNIFAWLKNGVKLTFITGILYLVGLNIPSAALCFIAYKQLKKAQSNIK